MLLFLFHGDGKFAPLYPISSPINLMAANVMTMISFWTVGKSKELEVLWRFHVVIGEERRTPKWYFTSSGITPMLFNIYMKYDTIKIAPNSVKEVFAI